MRVSRSGLFLALAWRRSLRRAPPTAEPARAVKVTVLSTMLAGNPGAGIGEWGFAALLEADGQRLLIDTGERPDTVLRNAAELGIDLSRRLGRRPDAQSRRPHGGSADAAT